MHPTPQRLKQLLDRLHGQFLGTIKIPKGICPQGLNTQVLSWPLKLLGKVGCCEDKPELVHTALTHRSFLVSI